MSTRMRAKMRITSIKKFGDQETLFFNAVAKDGPYPSDGSDEDNTFAKFSPSGSLQLTVANPNLVGKYTEGDTFYLDFVPVEPKAEQPAVEPVSNQGDDTKIE